MNALRALLPEPVRNVGGFARFIWQRLNQERCLEAAGSLTFTTLLALVPLLTIALAVMSAFPMFDDVGMRFKTFLLGNLVPEAAGKIITVYMRQFTDNADRLTTVGMITLGVTALAMMATIERTFNRVWRVSKPRPVHTRLLTYWSVITLGPMLIGASLTLTHNLASVGGGWLDAILQALTPGLLALIGFLVLYRVVPNCPVPTSHAWAAAIFSTIMFDVMKRLFALYIKKFATFKLIYGAFSSVPIFLLWLYIAWVIVITGAVLSASLSYWRGQAFRRPSHSGQRLYDAVRLLLKLEDFRQAGQVASLDALRHTLAIGQDELTVLLERMSDQQWVECTRDEDWVLSAALERIQLADLYALLVAREARMAGEGDVLHGIVDTYMNRVDQQLRVPISSLRDSALLAGSDR
ncbi:YihY family inner membrane protein [Burkholderiaceae bacterium DAT-1]|nr:YihY family inner membrane protein [Burkholderiaceae bacterium DAT-1]